MRRALACLLTLILLMGAGFVLLAQTTKKTDDKPAVQKTEARPAVPSTLPSPATVNAFLEHMFGYDPSIRWQVAEIKASAAAGLAEVDVVLSNPQGQQLTKLYVNADGKFALIGDLIPFGADPFAAARNELQAAAHGPSQGPAGALLTIVEFGDLQCPSCKAAQPTIEKLTQDLPSTRLIFQPFPLPMHNWALKAADYGECVTKQSNEAFFKFMKAVYQKQEDITLENADEQLKAAATSAGVNAEAVAACAVLPATEARVKQSVALGTNPAIEVTGTPTLFLNGRKIANVNGMPYEILKAIAQYQATHK
jgi:protein-disulfide isomerase